MLLKINFSVNTIGVIIACLVSYCHTHQYSYFRRTRHSASWCYLFNLEASPQLRSRVESFPNLCQYCWHKRLSRLSMGLVGLERIVVSRVVQTARAPFVFIGNCYQPVTLPFQSHLSHFDLSLAQKSGLMKVRASSVSQYQAFKVVATNLLDQPLHQRLLHRCLNRDQQSSSESSL